jgi:hypothetical protein
MVDWLKYILTQPTLKEPSVAMIFHTLSNEQIKAGTQKSARGVL